MYEHDQEDRQPLWRKFEFAGVVALVVSIICVVVGQSAEQLVTNSVVEVAQSGKATPKFNAIDFAETGSTGATRIVIGPCDTRRP